MQRAEANLRKAELDLGRAKELVLKGATSQAALDTAVAAEESTRADLAIAKANVENAKATLLQREATLDSARIDLDRTYIRSPIDGVVIDKIVEVGQTVAASLQAPKLFTIAQDLNHVQIEAQVDEADIGQVTRDNPVNFTVDAYPDATFEGTVEQIRLTPIALQNVVTYTVVIAADNPLGRLLPGMTANVEIVTGEHANVVVVPNDALRYQPRGPAETLVSDTSATGATRTASKRRRAHRPFARQADGRPGADPRGDRQGALWRRGRVRCAPQRRTSRRRGSQEDAREQARLRVAKVLRAVLPLNATRSTKSSSAPRPTSPRSALQFGFSTPDVVVPHHVRLGLSDAWKSDGLEPGPLVVLRAREIDRVRTTSAGCLPSAADRRARPSQGLPPWATAQRHRRTARQWTSRWRAARSCRRDRPCGFGRIDLHENLVGALDTPASGSLPNRGARALGASAPMRWRNTGNETHRLRVPDLQPARAHHRAR